MVPCAAASAPSAPNRQLVTACEVSTLPATTAAGYSGDSIELLRDHDVDRPQAAGIHRDVVVDHDAEHIEHGRARHRLGRVEVESCCGEVPVKSTVASRFFLSTVIFTLMAVP